MRTLNYVLLAVRDPIKSAALYTQVLGREPVNTAPTFVLYVLPTGLRIGLWLAADIEPKALPAGGLELSFTEDSKDAVVATHEEWKRLGLTIVQEPTAMDFGFTFVAEDSDGHRLRPFFPAERPQ